MKSLGFIAALVCVAAFFLAAKAPAQEATHAYNKVVRDMEADYRNASQIRARAARKQAYIDHGKRSAKAWVNYLAQFPDSKHEFSAKMNMAQALQMAKEKQKAKDVADAAAALASNFFEIRKAADVCSLVHLDKKRGWDIISEHLNKVTAPAMKADLHMELLKYVEIPKKYKGRKKAEGRNAYRKNVYLQVCKQVAKEYPGTESGRLAKMMVQGLQVKVGSPCVNLKVLQDEKSKPLDMDDYKGKVVLLHFWTSRSSTKKYMPDLIKVLTGLKPKGLEVIAVNCDYIEDRGRMETMIDDIGLPFRVYHDGEKLRNKVAMVYYVRKFPFNIIIGKDGKILNIGENTIDLQDTLPEILAGP